MTALLACNGPCPLCGSVDRRRGFCCDGCHAAYMAKQHEMWSMPGTARDAPEPPEPEPDKQQAPRRRIVRDIMMLIRAMRLLLWHPILAAMSDADAQGGGAISRGRKRSNVYHGRPGWRAAIEAAIMARQRPQDCVCGVSGPRGGPDAAEGPESVTGHSAACCVHVLWSRPGYGE